MNLSVQIMAHPARADLAADLAARLDLDETEHITWDRINDPWETGARAWQAAAGRRADWSMVVQDDVLPCLDFIPAVAKAVERMPRSAIVSPFLGRNQPSGYGPSIVNIAERASTLGACWISTRPLLWAIAVAVPTATIARMIAWGERRNHPSYHRRIARYYLRLGYRSLYTWPSLADHRGDESLLTRLGPQYAPGRTALSFVGADSSGLDFDWTGPTVRAEP